MSQESVLDIVILKTFAGPSPCTSAEGEGVKSFSITVDDDEIAPMRDGTKLSADVFRPTFGRHPVLLQRTPYGKRTLVGAQALLDAMRAARSGFAVVIQDVRGRGASEGEFQPFLNESSDGYDTVEWAAIQPWSNGDVAMYGSSYMGATQWQAAIATPPSLVSMCPAQATADYFEGRSYRGGAFELGSLLSIALFGLGSGSLDRVARNRSERSRLWQEARDLLSDLTTLSSCSISTLRESVLGTVAPYFFDWYEHKHRDEYWEEMAVIGKYGNVTVPALHISSWYDPYLLGTITNYMGMRDHGGSTLARKNQFMLIGPWTHYACRTSLAGTARIGQMDAGLSALTDLDALQIAWFLKWLRDDDSAWRMQSHVRVFVMGEGSWRNEDDWPLARAKPHCMYLHSEGNANTVAGDGSLSLTEPNRERPDRFGFERSNPVPTLGGAHLILESSYPHGAMDQQQIEARPDVLVYSSEPLTAPLEVTGEISAELWVTSNTPSADIVAKLVDVYPDGRALNVCDGIRRLTQLNSDEPTCVNIELGSASQLFGDTHRIRLDISSSNFPRFDLPFESTTKQDKSETTLFHDASCPSHLIIPVVQR